MKKYIAALVAALLLALVSLAKAQDAPPQENDQVVQSPQGPQDGQFQSAPDQQSDQQDASGPEQASETQQGVARVSQVQGDVSSQRGDNGQWVAVTVNTPISQDDRVSTGEKSRAELQLDFADILRLSDRSTARIAALNRTQIQVQVGQGLVTYSVLKGSEAHSEIDTPNSSIRPLDGDGEFRIIVNSEAETKVIVRRGSADISTSQGSTRVDAGQMITIAGTDNPQYQVSTANERDDWDRWNNDRNRSISGAGSWNKTNRYYTGSEDLDNNGVWTEVPDYGRVWVPSQGPGWAPYRAGRWVYQPYYGWTWVSYEPWGWAPYHYGRWFVYGSGWAWWPGPVAVYPAYYPIWAPAYVSFLGWGGGGWGVGVGFGFGGGFGRVGWLPIGPCDRFHPWWGRGGDRVNNVNVTNIHNTTIINNRGWAPLRGSGGRQFSNLNEVSRNQRVRSGISAMDGNKFGREAVPAHQGNISAASFKQASLMTGKVPVTPSRESFSPTSKAPGASSVRNAPASSQHFFSPSARSSTAVAANTGARNTGVNSNARAAGNVGARTPSSPQQGAASQQHAQNNQSSQNGRTGWQHFSPPPSRGTPSSGSNQPTRAYQPPASSSSRGGYPSASNRPPLNMNKPVVQPRGGNPSASRGGHPAAQPRGNYPAAQPRGNYPAAQPRGNYPAAQPRGNYPSGARGPNQGAPPSVYRGGSPGTAPRSAPRPPSGASAPRSNSGGASHSSSGSSSNSGSGSSSSSHSSGRPR
jgi:hypothetical protein